MALPRITPAVALAAPNDPERQRLLASILASVGTLSHAERFCQEGPNKGKPGVCPGEHASPGDSPAPATGTSSPEAHPPATPETRASALSRLVGGTKALRAGASAAAKRLGGAVWDRLPPKVQKTAAGLFAGATWIEHKLQAPYKAAQKLVRQVATERGLPQEHADRVARIVALADGAARWTVNVPALHHALEAVASVGGAPGFVLAKAAYYVPVGSMAYLAYSTARNPWATLRAAQKLFAGQLATAHAEFAETSRAVVVKLLEAFGRAADPDAFEALVLAAFDRTHDLGTALAAAEKAALVKHAEADAQRKSWTCGPAALKWAAARLGAPDQTEDTLSDDAGGTPDEGTPPDGLARAARNLGLDVQARHGMSLAALGRECVHGHPVLCCIQSPDAVKYAEHDVKDEKRDEDGRWTSGGTKGQPSKKAKVMYRGVGEGADTTTGFEWHSTTPELAAKYANFRGGKVKSSLVDVQSPFHINNAKAVLDARSFFSDISKQTDMRNVDKKTALEARKAFLDHFGDEKREVMDYWSNPAAKAITRELLEAMGFDGINMTEGGEETTAALRSKSIYDRAETQHAERFAEDQGHWVTVTRAGLRSVAFFDPATGEERQLPANRFEDLWHDRSADGTPFVHFGIILSKPAAAPAPAKPAAFAERDTAVVQTPGGPLHVHFAVTLPEGKAPVVNVAAPPPATVNVAAPIVTVSPPEVHVAAPVVTVQAPPVKLAEERVGPLEVRIVGLPDRVTEVQRDGKGDATGKVERDAREE